jgi:hypothetical protein
MATKPPAVCLLCPKTFSNSHSFLDYLLKTIRRHHIQILNLILYYKIFIICQVRELFFRFARGSLLAKFCSARGARRTLFLLLGSLLTGAIGSILLRKYKRQKRNKCYIGWFALLLPNFYFFYGFWFCSF